MSGQAAPPGLRLRRTLLDRLDAVGAEIETVGGMLRDLNRSGLGRTFGDLQSILDSGRAVLANHTAGISSNIADDLAALLSATQAIEISPIDPQTGEESYTLQQLDNAQSRLVRALLRALDAARAVGVVPTELDLPGGEGFVVPRSGNEDLLRDIAANLDRVATRLEALEATRADAVFQQGNFIAFYIGRMNVQIDLAKLQLKVGEQTIDFAALVRAGTAMAELTEDFFATITAWAGRISKRITAATRTVSRAVADASRGLGRAIRTVWARRSAVAIGPPAEEPPAEEGPPPDFDINRATRLILEGKAPPVPWWPYITHLDLSGGYRRSEMRRLYDLSPLQALTNLKTLYLAYTQVVDLSPLQALINLQTLSCDYTPVADLSPLQSLTNLQRLHCTNTQVADLSPLQSLTNLQRLHCTNTQVADLAPLQALTNLERLDCANTQVADLAPLQALANLQEINCDNTQVADLAPLQALTNLQRLDCRNTQVADLTPLQALTNLQWLACANTPVADLAPLQALTNLQRLDCDNTQVADLAPLQALTNLKRLDCANTQVADLAPLQTLINLQTLICRGTLVTDVSVLRHLTTLTIVAPQDAK